MSCVTMSNHEYQGKLMNSVVLLRCSTLCEEVDAHDCSTKQNVKAGMCLHGSTESICHLV